MKTAAQETPIRAFHLPTQTWRFASYSGLPGQRVPNVFRVDPDHGEDLGEFVCYEVEMNEDRSFFPKTRLDGWKAIYS